MGGIDPKFLVVFLGFIFLAGGAAGISGRWKRWYFSSRRMAMAYFPAGILFLLEAVRQSVSDGTPLSWVLKGAEILSMAVAIWWIMRPPKFIIPAWIQTIEAHPRAVYDYMAMAVKNKEEWRSKVETPEALEEWIALVERRLKINKKKK
jgi:hypothetical protein